MKIRIGFASNSSCTNFIVRIGWNKYSHVKEDHVMANKEDIEKLKKWGFKESNIDNPFRMDETQYWAGENNKHVTMKYDVDCNQDEIIAFLVDNNIPFKASVHYHQEFWSYKKDSDYIFVAPNYGIALEMYGEDLYDCWDAQSLKDDSPFKKVPKNEWIEHNSYDLENHS